MLVYRMNADGIDNEWYQPEQVSRENWLPNCTHYAKCCIAEIRQRWDRLFEGCTEYGYPDAKNWYDRWLGPKGQEPRAGGICVWGDKGDRYGHVAFVLECNVIEGGWEVRCAESRYGSVKFQLIAYDMTTNEITPKIGMRYIGCCYTDLDDRRTERNEGRNQCIISYDFMRVRTSPDGEIRDGLFYPKGTYDVLERKGDWLKLDEGHWVGIVDGCCDYYPAGYEPVPDPTDVDELIEELNRAVGKLQTEAANLAMQIKERDATIDGAKKDFNRIREITQSWAT